MIRFLHRLYQRDVDTGTYRGTLAAALAMIGASAVILTLLARLPFREVLTAEATVEPVRTVEVRGDSPAILRRNSLRLGAHYAAGAPLVTVDRGDGAERIYASPCDCELVRSDLLSSASGTVAPGALIAELIDVSQLELRFPVNDAWHRATAVGSAVHVTDDRGVQRRGTIARVVPLRTADHDKLGVEAVATLPTASALTLGTQLTVHWESPPVPLWRFLLRSVGR
jgi:hypothetical protein